MLQRLIYFSERDRSCVDVRELVTQAAEQNKRRGITGLLIADDRCFVQLLEGHRNAVSSLFHTISMDARHRNIVLVEAVEIDEVRHPTWGMSKFDDKVKIAATWRRVKQDRVFDPWSLSAYEIKDFLALVAFELASAREAARAVASSSARA